VLTSQPFPNSVKQNQKVDDPIVVRLLTGAKADVKPHCIVTGEIVTNIAGNSPRNPPRNQPPIVVENAQKNMNEQGLAAFDNLKFPTGTRLKGIRMKFSTKINVPDKLGTLHTLTLESPTTGTIVVKTNENQWWEAEGILTKKTAFEGQSEISWYKLANWLQRRYIGATRQHMQNPMRPLSSHDFKYIHR
jgi:hypothetical protein